MKYVAMLFIFALVAALALLGGSALPAEAQSDEPDNKPQAVKGDKPGEAIVTWTAVDHASFYRIGWISVADYHASIEAEQDWKDYFVSVSVANEGQTTHTVTGLTPGEQYWFRVGSSYRRYQEPDWSPWSNLLTLGGECDGDRDALVKLYETTNGDRYWRNKLNWNTDTPIGTWFGVSTDGDGCVVVLLLESNLLIGELPPEIGNLSRLDTLDLDGNYLEGRDTPRTGRP